MIKIRDLEPSDTVARELALFKISCQDGDARAQVMQFTEIFRGKTVDVSKRSVTVEITGTDDKIEAFENMVRPFGLIELIRTGEIAVAPRPQRHLGRTMSSFGMHVMQKDDTIATARLEERVSEALSGARRSGTARSRRSRCRSPPSSTSVRPFWQARRPDDRFACLEQPDRDGFVLAALGQAAVLEARGPSGSREVAAAARELGAERVRRRSRPRIRRGPPASGPVFVGGFAFADDGGSRARVERASRRPVSCCRRWRWRSRAARRA